jgi:hypothetical protein
MDVRFERVRQADAVTDTKSDADADNANADHGYAEHSNAEHANADHADADDGHAEHANADHTNADHGHADSYSDDGDADQSTDGRRGRLDFDAASVRRQLDVELLGALQQHRQSVLHPGSWLAAAWAAHAAHQSPSVPKPNRSDVRPPPITFSRTRPRHLLPYTRLPNTCLHALRPRSALRRRRRAKPHRLRLLLAQKRAKQHLEWNAPQELG